MTPLPSLHRSNNPSTANLNSAQRSESEPRQSEAPAGGPAGPPSDTVTVRRSPPEARATGHISSSPSPRRGGPPPGRRPGCAADGPRRPQPSSPDSLRFLLRGSTDTVSPPGDDSRWAPGDGLSVTAVIVASRGGSPAPARQSRCQCDGRRVSSWRRCPAARAPGSGHIARGRAH